MKIERQESITRLLDHFSSQDLPGAKELGLSQASWLEIYWDKKGKEMGKALTDNEKAWDIPLKSDPLEWSREDWGNWID